LIFNTAFCGQWAGRVWKDGACGSKAATCEEYVANNPKDMVEAYWLVKSVRVYENKGAGGAQGGKKAIRGANWRQMFADAETRVGI